MIKLLSLSVPDSRELAKEAKKTDTFYALIKPPYSVIFFINLYYSRAKLAVDARHSV